MVNFVTFPARWFCWLPNASERSGGRASPLNRNVSNRRGPVGEPKASAARWSRSTFPDGLMIRMLMIRIDNQAQAEYDSATE